MNYNLLLQESYKEYLRTSEHLHDGSESQTELKADFLSGDVFNLTTYDSALDILFVTDIMEVVKAIHTSTTFDYFRDDQDKYVKYITCVNFPWFTDKLDWGGSIRGAWWEYFNKGEGYMRKAVTQVGDGCLWYEGKQTKVEFDNRDGWILFVDELIKFWENKQ